MKTVEQKLKELLEEHTRVSLEYNKKIIIARKELQQRNNCTHSVKESFTWVYDNGFGSSGTRNGMRCVLCLVEDCYAQHGTFFYANGKYCPKI
mgnify:FL=1